ncbi:MAG: glycoside hydrolase family protein [Myxococcota bacterium]|nr:glycoside hydrolase family protein [Myxococcota bacterium]
MRAILRATALGLLGACGTPGVGPGFPTSVDGSATDDGASSAAFESGSSSRPDAGGGGSGSGGGSGVASSSSGGGAVPSVPDASTEDVAAGTDGSAAADGANANPDAPVGDGGIQPYRGVANSACADLLRLGVSWWYNWTSSPGSCASPPFVPMIWGHAGNEQSAAGIKSAITNIVGAGRKTVLGFNEPDNTGQSNISVASAIALWPSFDNPAVRIGSPATQGNTAGLGWIQNFMSQVNADTTGTLRVDFIATHWYGWNSGSCDASAVNLEAWLKQIEAIPGNRPIWLTEWGCLNQSNPTAAGVQAFYSGAISMFARHPRLERYAWYPWFTNGALVATGGALTSLGTAYAAAPAYR